MISDGDLVRRAVAGQAAAFGELVRRWAARVTAVCHGRVGRHGVAEDLAQEAFLRAYRALPTLVDPEKFGSWACGIASRACLDWLKAKERTQVTFSTLGGDGNPEEFLPAPGDGEPPLDREDEHSNLMAEVEKLPERYRQALMLFYYEDMSYRDIAELLGVSAAAVNAWLTKARAILRDRLSAHFHESG